MEQITIKTEYIKLDQLLKFAGTVGAGSDAKFLITNGYVMVNGETVLARGKKIYDGDQVFVSYEGQEFALSVHVEKM